MTITGLSLGSPPVCLADAGPTFTARMEAARRTCNGGGDCWGVVSFAEHLLDEHQPELAREALEEACNRGGSPGNMGACLALGEQLRVGERGIHRDPNHAASLYARACEVGNDTAGCYLVATMLERGAGTPSDPAKSSDLRARARTRLVTELRGSSSLPPEVADALERNDPRAAGEILRNACVGPSTAHCETLYRFADLGAVQVDASVSTAAAERACNAALQKSAAASGGWVSMGACYWLAGRLRAGEEVPRDERAADSWRSKAEDATSRRIDRFNAKVAAEAAQSVERRRTQLMLAELGEVSAEFGRRTQARGARYLAALDGGIGPEVPGWSANVQEARPRRKKLIRDLTEELFGKQ